MNQLGWLGFERALHTLNILFVPDSPVCGHPGLPDGGELVSPPGPGLAQPGARAVFSAGDVVVFGCQASPQQTPCSLSSNYCHQSKLSSLERPGLGL